MRLYKDVKAKTQQTKPSWQSEDLAFPGCHRDPHFACLCPSHSPLLSPHLLNQSCISTVACQASCCRRFTPSLRSLLLLLFRSKLQYSKAQFCYHACNTQKHNSVPCTQQSKAQFCIMHPILKSTILYHAPHIPHAPNTLTERAKQAHVQIAFISAHQTIETQQNR